MFRHRRGLNLLFGPDLCGKEARTSCNSGSSPDRKRKSTIRPHINADGVRILMLPELNQVFVYSIIQDQRYFCCRWFRKPTTVKPGLSNSRAGRVLRPVHHRRRRRYRHRQRRDGLERNRTAPILVHTAGGGQRRCLQELPRSVATQDAKVFVLTIVVDGENKSVKNV